ncbi:MAG: hypothetical protein V1824_02065 [archaeon]
MKKGITLTMFILLLSLNLIAAINLNVDANPILDVIVTELDEPAIFDLTIQNLGESSNFEIYSLVGMDISPEDSFFISSGDIKIIRVYVDPQEAIKSKLGYINFKYQIKNELNEIQDGTLTLNIIELNKAISIIPNNINSKLDEITILIKNNINLDFNDLKITLNSAFFEYEDNLPLKALETKQINIPINKEKIKTLNAGNYLLNTEIKTFGKSEDIESIIKFLEQEDIESEEIYEGIIIKRHEVMKHNLGNTKKTIIITDKKNLFSYLFTTTNIEPTRTEIKGLKKYYIWEKELIPNEEIRVIIKTNWFFPVIIILLIIGLIIIIRKSIETDLSLRKHVSFVKTKGGEFALKVSVRIRAKKFIERINITDKLPALVHLYERYGAISPDKVDLNNKRMEWNLPALNQGEERIFSYIIYSKIGIVGRFELPEAKVVYEKEGKIKQARSNRSFFINEPDK